MVCGGKSLLFERHCYVKGLTHFIHSCLVSEAYVNKPGFINIIRTVHTLLSWPTDPSYQLSGSLQSAERDHRRKERQNLIDLQVYGVNKTPLHPV